MFQVKLTVDPPYKDEEHKSLITRVLKPLVERYITANPHLTDLTNRNACYTRTAHFPNSPKTFMMEFFCFNLEILCEVMPAVLKDVDLVIKDRLLIERPIVSQRLLKEISYIEANEPIFKVRILEDTKDNDPEQ